MTVPSINDHLAQARANRAYAEWVLMTAQSDPTALQWLVTAAFYSALHGLTAYLVGQGIVVKNHTERGRAPAAPNSGVSYRVQTAYRVLQEASRGGRYELRAFTSQEVRGLLDHELAAIASFTGM
jgi:hypothetical protein